MNHLPAFRTLIVAEHTNALAGYLSRTAASVASAATLPALLDDYEVIIVDSAVATAHEAELARFISAGGACLALCGPDSEQLPAIFGVQPTPAGPEAILRILFTERDNPLGARLPDAFDGKGPFQTFDVEADDVVTVLYADWRYTHRPMLTSRRLDDGWALATTLTDLEHPLLQRILYRVLRRASGLPHPSRTLGVGLLGYAPSVGELHGQAAAATPGLALITACDLNQARLDAAQAAFANLTVTTSADEMLADPRIDIVVIATPPNTHAALALKALEAGKHVIVEKPLALTSADVEKMIALAEAKGVHLSCHQNRHWDIDFLAIRQAVQDGLLGHVFQLETYIGGYGHPCGFWHSHDAVSGGTTFDWGAHYLDWVLALMPGKVTEIICTRQNRVWHDITNADQERIQLRFEGGEEAEFTHSDLAFIPKPKWYICGTTGTLVGEWRQVTSYTIDPVRYYDTHDVPPAELGADLTLRRLQGRETIVEQTLPLPPRPHFPFHHNLADHLLLGEPITVPVAHSARVVQVLEAAKRSADNEGRVESVSI